MRQPGQASARTPRGTRPPTGTAPRASWRATSHRRSSTHGGRSARTIPIGVGGSFTCACAIANGVSPLNGSLRGEQAVEHHAHGVEIGARVDLVAQHLFGRHVGRRAHHEPGVRQVLGARHARDAEVHDLDGPGLGDHHVGGLQIAMHDAHAVRVGQRGERLHAQLGGPLRVTAARSLDHAARASRRARTP